MAGMDGGKRSIIQWCQQMDGDTRMSDYKSIWSKLKHGYLKSLWQVVFWCVIIPFILGGIIRIMVDIFMFSWRLAS